MQYQQFIGANGERFLLPILAGAAILSAPFWLNNNNNNKCCNNYYPQPYPYPYPVYPNNYYPQPYPYPYQQQPIYQNTFVRPA